MQIRRLSVHQVRNFSAKSWQFGRVTVIVGANGSGKTTLLEAVALLGTAQSFRAGKIAEVIRLGQELGRISGEIETDGEVLSLELLLTRGLVQGQRTQSRLFSVNGVRRRKADFLGNLAVVVFRPEDLRLIEGSPARRREYLDLALSGVDFSYAEALTQYEKALKTRNRLLQLIQEGRQPQTTLTYWNQLLWKHGEVIQLKRRDFLAFLNQIGFALELGVRYEPSIISEQHLNDHLEKEILVGHSLIGPHKDDFVVHFPGSQMHLTGELATEALALSAYGSRGQQRLAVLWLKLGELLFAETKLAQAPVLLLDDVMSELDSQSRAVVLGWLKKYQSVLTTAEAEILPEIKTQVPDLVEYRL
ncbi:MAG TPA: hypothetical protein DEP87_00660 [Candidatus Pacebacteria bacterium]|nr:hypothetical protein [Candidatus Paceibacterota bacterium]